jgi:hypothetical protein
MDPGEEAASVLDEDFKQGDAVTPPPASQRLIS